MNIIGSVIGIAIVGMPSIVFFGGLLWLGSLMG